MSVTDTHEEKETLSVDVLLPGHEARGDASALFIRTKKALAERDGNRCWLSGETPEEAGPLEAHHFPIERSTATGIDWALVQADCAAGEFGLTQTQRDAAKAFDWSKFDPADPYSFVDNMLVNGVLLAKRFHTAKDSGIHTMPHPLWIFQRYAREGYQFSPTEVIHHEHV
jgi:hypothetical protein